jgi:hypothetical protein
MDLLQKSFKLYGQMIVASFMCFILVMSFNMMGTAFLTKAVGYTVHGSLKQDEEPVKLYEYYYEDGEDQKYEEYEKQGYTLIKNAIRTQTSKKDGIIWDVVTQIFLIFMIGVFVYNNLWNTGRKDKNAVDHNLQKEDKFKGFKIGLVAMVPSYVLLTVLAIGKATFAKKISIAIFAFLNTHLYEAILLITDGGGYISTLGVWQIIVFYALFLIVPIIAEIAYILGYKDIIVSERLTYKKK